MSNTQYLKQEKAKRGKEKENKAKRKVQIQLIVMC